MDVDIPGEPSHELLSPVETNVSLKLSASILNTKKNIKEIGQLYLQM